MFAVTNIDHMLVLSVFFGQAGAHQGRAWRVVAGQYLGFSASWPRPCSGLDNLYRIGTHVLAHRRPPHGRLSHR
jgi:hypothetical protein